MNVTIMSDASRCPKTKVSGYGFWAVSDRGKASGGGVFKNNNGQTDSINTAEMMAAVNAVYVALSRGILKKGDNLLIQLDSQHAMRVLKGVVNPSIHEQSGIDVFSSITKGISVRFRHVKGHTKRKGNRYLANSYCDEIAGKHMRKARQLISNKGTNQ